MDSMKASQVFNGSHGELWIDGESFAEVTAFNAEVNLEKAEIKIVKKLCKNYKVTGYECKGKVKLNKVSSYMIRKLSDSMKQAKQVSCEIISYINDPDAIGAERVVVKDAVFDKLILADWEAGKMGEEEYDYTFTDWDVLETAA